jgi:hypothetical protein
MHLDLAADSVNESPNPHIRDLKIKYTWPELAKILARFQPISPFSKPGFSTSQDARL